MNITELAMLKKMAGNGGGNGGGGASGGGIIDVTELPTTNINENAIYRTIGATFYMGGEAQNTTIHIVNGLPASGEPFTLDGQTLNAGYYNNNDGVLYFYVTQELSAMGLPVGWLTAEQVAQIFDAMLAGGAGFVTYGGVVESLDDVVGKPYMYLLLSRPLYFYKNGKWREVATDGASLSLKTKMFTSLEDMMRFCSKKEVYNIRGEFKYVQDFGANTDYMVSKNVFAYRSDFSDGYYIGIDIEFYSRNYHRFDARFNTEYDQDGNLIVTTNGGLIEQYTYQNNDGVLIADGIEYSKIISVEPVGAIIVQYFA